MVQLERLMKGASSAKGRVDSVALLESGQHQGITAQSGKNHRDYKPEGKKWCRYCKKEGHIILDCYRLKNKKKQEGEHPFTGACDSKLSESGGSSSAGSDVNLHNLLTPYQFEKLRIMLARSPSPSPPSSPHLAPAAPGRTIGQ
ncbi:unnamed protein product [Linum trigynum]|uniref:CCHC-type domain-containing protein n=1 Tax=Linum trigynum TaxID=586398 RepID=A0AAV2FU40_9ROSI